MSEIHLVKLPDGKLKGMSDRDQVAYNRFRSRLANAEPGEVIEIEAKLPRNSKYHRKFFALLNLGFDHWEPGRKHKQYRGMPVAKNFDHFRKEVTILAGFYEQTFDLDGNMKLEAQSISFAKMENDEFEMVYSAVMNVLLDKVFSNYKGRADVDSIIEQIMRFA
ncbi:DUF1367 family protein [Methylophilus flavus]|uniref:DUF1367 family protein n=1 Tax=Methylophilus flavus TaxID=640084 RepID=A0ABW3PB75_9PROT